MLTDAFPNAMLRGNIAVQQCITYANWSCRDPFSPLFSLVLLNTSTANLEKETLDLIASGAQGKVSRAAASILNPHAAFLHPSGKQPVDKARGVLGACLYFHHRHERSVNSISNSNNEPKTQTAETSHRSFLSKMSEPGVESDYVTLISSDGYSFVVQRSSACISGAIKRMLDPSCRCILESPEELLRSGV